MPALARDLSQIRGLRTELAAIPAIFPCEALARGVGTFGRLSGHHSSVNNVKNIAVSRPLLRARAYNQTHPPYMRCVMPPIMFDL